MSGLPSSCRDGRDGSLAVWCTSTVSGPVLAQAWNRRVTSPGLVWAQGWFHRMCSAAEMSARRILAKGNLVFAFLALLLAACSTSQGEETPATTSTQVTTTETAPTTTAIAYFPLAGTWSGTAQNGDFTLDVTLTLHSGCLFGEKCGAFDLPTIPCSGTYILRSVEDDVYRFDILDKTRSCGTGVDYLRLLPDDTVEWISRGDYGENRGILRRGPLVEPPVESRPVLYADDGSPDGTVALLYMLSDPAVVVEAVVISHGEAHPQVYIQHIGRLLDSLGLAGIPLGYGADTAIIPTEDFPEWIRGLSDGFWGHPVPNPGETYPVERAAGMIVRVLNQATEPLAVFVSGPCTDLALALRQDPGISEHIEGLYIMGGAVHVPGNLADFSANPENVTAEWNIYADPLAASEVLGSGLPVYLVPLDATNQVSASMSDTGQWRGGGVAAELAADFYDGLLGGSSTSSMSLWDVMTAVVMVHPDLCQMVPMHLEVVTEQGITYGQTRLVEGGEPNVHVCLEPDASGIRQTLIDAFSMGE